MGQIVVVKEVDGGREVEMEVTPEYLYLETGEHCYIFDRAIVLHAMKKMFRISVILEHGQGLEEDFALP
ncbi:hypothetical protein [Streptomyces sp. AC495_CC817]|uniref:hypothetical protein n=1 Tax=Streptomyces sp. AC495_CC817 TaxID=2823900 RepID=UPI001C272974|nr:hypothetical protein [Streptomyces sp. AC495_CC817]